VWLLCIILLKARDESLLRIGERDIMPKQHLETRRKMSRAVRKNSLAPALCRRLSLTTGALADKTTPATCDFPMNLGAPHRCLAPHR